MMYGMLFINARHVIDALYVYVVAVVYAALCCSHGPRYNETTWWRNIQTLSALLAICAENSPVPGEFPARRPVTQSFDVFFDLRPNKRFSKQSWGWWSETPSSSLWRHRNGQMCLLFLWDMRVIISVVSPYLHE